MGGMILGAKGVRFWGASLLFVMDAEAVRAQDAEKIAPRPPEVSGLETWARRLDGRAFFFSSSFGSLQNQQKRGTPPKKKHPSFQLAIWCFYRFSVCPLQEPKDQIIFFRGLPAKKREWFFLLVL